MKNKKSYIFATVFSSLFVSGMMALPLNGAIDTDQKANQPPSWNEQVNQLEKGTRYDNGTPRQNQGMGMNRNDPNSNRWNNARDNNMNQYQGTNNNPNNRWNDANDHNMNQYQRMPGNAPITPGPSSY